MAFEIHPRLAAGSHPLGLHNRCHILLKDNAVFPWIVIVPETPDGIEDLHQLPLPRYHEILTTVHAVSHFVSDHFLPDKLNVGWIGNQVRQLHIHVVGRSASDPAWPGTVWASDVKRRYEPDAVSAIREAARPALGLC